MKPGIGAAAQAVLDTLATGSRVCSQWGSAPDGSPILSARCGGPRSPGVLVTAGVHAHEAGGVQAALRLLAQVDTRHTVHILPLRDPMGYSGVNHTLSFAAGRQVSMADHAAVLDFLTGYGRLLWQQGETHCFLLGEVGFLWRPQAPGLQAFVQANADMAAALAHSPQDLSPLYGQRVFLVNPAGGAEPGSSLAPCWQGWISADGRWLNLNRGFGEAEQPAEVAALQQALQVLQPGLVIDLQEDDVPGFWFVAPAAQSGNPVLRRLFSAVEAVGHQQQVPLYSVEQMRADSHRDLLVPGFLEPEEAHPGVYWLDQRRLHQGENFISYAGRQVVAIGVEAPLQRPLDQRVEETVRFVSALIRAWEQAYS